MNDHITVTGGASHVTNFIKVLEDNIKILLREGISVIIIGFFQQNTLWDLEDINGTQTFNKEMKSLCLRYKIPFVGIFDIFNKFEEGGAIVEDLTADWMHHPNNFGHKIYFSKLVPYFTSKDVKASEIANFVLY